MSDMDELQVDGMIVLDSVGKVDDTCLVLEEIEDDLLDVLDIVPSITIAKVRKGYLSGNVSKQHADQNKVEKSEHHPGLDNSLSIIDQWFSSDTECGNSGDDSIRHTPSTPVAITKHPEENRSPVFPMAPPASTEQQHKQNDATATPNQPQEFESGSSPKAFVSAQPQNNAATANHPEEKRIAVFPIKLSDVANAKKPKESIASPLSPETSAPEQNKENDGATTKQPAGDKRVPSPKSLVPPLLHKHNDVAIAKPEEPKSLVPSSHQHKQNDTNVKKYGKNKNTASPMSLQGKAEQEHKQNDVVTIKHTEENKSAALPKSLISAPPQQHKPNNAATTKKAKESKISASSKTLVPASRQKQNDVAVAKQLEKNNSSPRSLEATALLQHEQNGAAVHTEEQPQKNKNATSPKSLIPVPKQHKQNAILTAKPPKKNKSFPVPMSPFPAPQQHEHNGATTTKQPIRNKTVASTKSLPTKVRQQHKLYAAAPSLLSLSVSTPKGRKRRKNISASSLAPKEKRPRQSKPALTPSPMILDPKRPQQNSKHSERDNAVPSLLALKLIGSKPKKPVGCPEQKRDVPQLFPKKKSKWPTLNGAAPFRASVTSTKGQNQMRSAPELFLQNESKRPALKVPTQFRASETSTKGQNQKRYAPSLLSLPLGIPGPHKENRHVAPLLSTRSCCSGWPRGKRCRNCFF